ncbi:restriction endonuclease subunit S [Escherichia coli]|uniref:restriction endonuclease subunit S n=1 Tax=Escherichia coli TaxID=562 RepID=UPI000DA5135D|nr:restriction endonuclease subunit S [Escherichia coli]EFA7452526.1 restriction endonuclease subunit S [Escherichia coli]EFA7457445.1 restriction endonuclease subunit S [Escherichia coli]EFA7568636.1 restriction endonuclease subunit S [Escherichia coli]EFB5963393.1 restriction endonuclease subunit S [Escherichia coli]EFC9695227.1 restriction endonuclease subunit S [Escherichia coli]
MSELNYLEKLLDGTEVEWKALGDVTSVLRGKRLTKNLLSAEEKFPVFHGGLEPLGYYNKSNRPANTVMIINVGASAGTVGYSTVDFWSSDGCFCLEHNELLNNRFLYFALIGYQSLLKSKVRVAGIPTLDAIVVNKLLIPIPCPENPEKSLAIQSEIVRILDTFTALTAELTAELNMRKKQYNYYRDQLLSFKEGEVEWKALEEVSDIYDSLHQTPQYSKNGLSMIRVTDIKNGYIDLKNTLKVNDGIFSIFTKKYLPQKNDLVMSRVGSYGNVGIIPTDNSACMGQNTVVIHPYINNRYLFYILTSSIGQDFIEKNVGGGSQKTLSLKSIKSIPIPLTGESEQSKIVSILDKFDTLTNSITEGLPREIELRQKQYEYYRDLLFSFPKPETVSN